jgi:tetratricopeptide (TPR) repeat protein
VPRENFVNGTIFSGIISDLERALEIEPRNVNALNWLGLAFGHIGRSEEALEVFRRCMDYDPYFAPCTENEYDTLVGLNRYDEALEHWQRALDQGVTTHQ